MRARRRAAASFALVVALAPAVAAGAGSGAGRAPRAAGSHIVAIVLENREYGQVIGDPGAPYLNRLARRGTLATRYHAIAHPSLPNYLALLGGSTFGIDEDCTSCTARGANLATQLSRAGISWRAYMEGLPHRCFAGAQAGDYVKRHNPFMYFPAVAHVRSRCRRVVPATRLDADLSRRSLPRFAWLTPDLCHGAHDCEIGVADRYLARLVPRIVRQLGPRGLLFLTFDEGTTDRGCCGRPGGGKVMTVAVGPGVARGARIGRPADHYALLATIEDRLGLPRLRQARKARPLPLPRRG